MECLIYSCSSSDIQISIPDKHAVILGRGPLTKIKERKCSKAQVELTANYDSKEVQLKQVLTVNCCLPCPLLHVFRLGMLANLLSQIGRNPSAIGATLLQQGDVRLLGPGSVFSFLQGKHNFVVQFVDNSSSPLKEDTVKKNPSGIGLKRTFQTLEQSISKEGLVNAVNCSQVIYKKMLTGEPNNVLQSMRAADACSSQCEDLTGEYKSLAQNLCNSSTEKKRKIHETVMAKSAGDLPSKLRKSSSGKLVSCASTEDQKIDFEGLREEFGDAIMQEIKKEQTLPKVDSTSESSNEAKCSSVPQDICQNNQPCKNKENIWINKDGLMVFSGKNLECRDKVACFDLDGTIICTKSGKVFPTSPNDWKLLFGNTKTKLKQLHHSNFKIIIFTNQKGLGKWKVSVDEFQQKIVDIQDILEVPLQCFVATCDDQFRKPSVGMWNELCTKYNGSEKIDIAKSLYVGDAAGRPANWTKGRKKDFSCADRCFAANVGITFHTPEEFFLNWNKSSFSWPVFNPNSVKKLQSLLHPDCSDALFARKTQEIILMVGFPACGKSMVSMKHFVSNGYEHVNRDTLGTWQKCVAACKSAVSQGKSVIIDNTNPDKKTRQRYIEVAKSENISIRCFWMMTSFEHSLHNNKFRELTNTSKHYKHVGRIAFNIYKSSFQEPVLEEGFEEVVKVNFVPQFSNKTRETLYFSYLL